MTEKQEKQDKPEKKVEPPPKTIDPKLEKRVDFKEKPRKKHVYRLRR